MSPGRLCAHAESGLCACACARVLFVSQTRVCACACNEHSFCAVACANVLAVLVRAGGVDLARFRRLFSRANFQACPVCERVNISRACA